MEISIEELENIFTNPSYSKEEIMQTFLAYEKSLKPKRGSAKEVFEDWKEVMEEPRAILSASRIKLINQRLQDYSVNDLKLVNRGCCLSAWHMGTDPNNKTGKIYNYPELLYRDTEHVERFKAIAIEHRISPDAKIRRSDYDGTKEKSYTEYEEFTPLRFI